MKITLAIAALGLSGVGLSGVGIWANAGGFQSGISAQSVDTQLQRQRATPRRSSPGFGVSADDPVVLELFTSQSCSSCPPADKLMTVLVRKPGLIIITRPVTYWDRLGWKDTLGRPENTNLQRAYARGKHEGSGVYTPQVVVDGRHGAIGADIRKLRGLIARSARLPAPDVTIKAARGGGYSVSLSGQLRGSAQLSLVALDSSETVGIGRGENRGRTVTYTNVVRDEEVIGTWNGGNANFTVSPLKLKVKGADRYVVLIQRSNAGSILAARYLK